MPGKKGSQISLIFFIFSLDRLAKFIVLKYLSVSDSIPVINGVFHLTLVYNRGAAFGMLKNQVPLFIFVSLAAIVLIFINLKKENSFLSRISLSLILAGALGNLVDRVFLGYVVDFLDFRIWPVFNIADSAITIGAILLGYTILKKPAPVKVKK